MAKDWHSASLHADGGASVRARCHAADADDPSDGAVDDAIEYR